MLPHERYKSNTISVSTNDQKMIIIFNAIMKVLNKAIACVKVNDFEGKNKYLQAAVEALTDLRIGIDIEKGDFAKTLDAFCFDLSTKIGFANIGAVDLDELSNIIKALAQVRDLFEEKQPQAN